MIKLLKKLFARDRETFRTITDPKGKECFDIDKTAPLPRINDTVFFGDTQGVVSSVNHHYSKDGTIFMITIRTA